MPGVEGVGRLAGRGQYAGVRDHKVQAAELVDGLLHRRFDTGVVAHVALGGKRPPAGFTDQPGGLAEILVAGHGVFDARDLAADVEDRHVGALAGEVHRVRAPLSARTAGDEGYFAVESSHATPPLWPDKASDLSFQSL